MNGEEREGQSEESEEERDGQRDSDVQITKSLVRSTRLFVICIIER